MAWLGVYALDLDNMDSAELWIERAFAIEESPAIADAYALLLSVRHASDPSDRLEAMEALWERYASRVASHAGWQAAIATKNSEAILRWSDRYVEERPREALTLVPSAYATPELRPRLVSQVRTFLTSPEPWTSDARALHLPIDAHLRRQARLFQSAMGTGAMLAAEAEDPFHARALAELGLDLAWESDALLRFARVLWSAGDHERALEALVRAEADPMTAVAAASAPWAADRGTDWSARLAGAQQDMRQYVMVDGVIRYLKKDPVLLVEGSRTTLSSIHGGEPTVIAFLSRYCAPALEDARLLPDLGAALEDMGARLVVVSVDNTAALDSYLETVGYDGPVYRDDRGDARSAFQSSQTADFFVMDASGRVRFEHSSPEELLRQVWAIRTPSGAPPAVTD